MRLTVQMIKISHSTNWPESPVRCLPSSVRLTDSPLLDSAVAYMKGRALNHTDATDREVFLDENALRGSWSGPTHSHFWYR